MIAVHLDSRAKIDIVFDLSKVQNISRSTVRSYTEETVREVLAKFEWQPAMDEFVKRHKLVKGENLIVQWEVNPQDGGDFEVECCLLMPEQFAVLFKLSIL